MSRITETFRPALFTLLALSASQPSQAADQPWAGSGSPDFFATEDAVLARHWFALSDQAFDGGLRDENSGTLSLRGEDPYPCYTTVDAGTLLPNGSLNRAALPAPLGFSGTLGEFTCLGLSLSPLTRLKIEIDSASGSTDRIDARGQVDLGSAELLVQDVAATRLPPGTKLTLLTYEGELSGSFANAPNGAELNVGANRFVVNYMDDNAVTLTIPSHAGPGYQEWAASKGLTGNHAAPNADPDDDGRTNLMEYALDGEPLLGMDDGKVLTATTAIPDQGEGLVVTLPVRSGTVFAGSGSKVSHEIDGMVYVIDAAEELVDLPAMKLTEVQGVSTNGLPMLSTGWEYRSFRVEGASEIAAESLRVKVEPAVSFAG
ncbi:hypothetical protein [Luteolibacter luteus]|uniref:Uncharacterized protein n=1 Tax=Luteolibacter luteus TaxID=2728835 RepID=A0A858RCA0_9BACT|nr:hypothetical protein [Luteolibacter luteus]QJE94417.1 hypothetical protein HHL09_00985 [Luteolibacter luteus]